jgi:hemerythrin-like metal-binding protein
MNTMEWSPALELGVGVMDDTHRDFVRLLNALGEASEQDMVARFDEFYAHTVAHFGQETEWMQRMDFPPLHCHQQEHEGVLEVMREVRGYLLEGKYDVGRVLAKELAAWFKSHATTMDAMLAQALASGGAQAEPIACGANASCAH